jgi:hypothetical protein
MYLQEMQIAGKLKEAHIAKITFTQERCVSSVTSVVHALSSTPCVAVSLLKTKT